MADAMAVARFSRNQNSAEPRLGRIAKKCAGDTGLFFTFEQPKFLVPITRFRGIAAQKGEFHAESSRQKKFYDEAGIPQLAIIIMFMATGRRSPFIRHPKGNALLC